MHQFVFNAAAFLITWRLMVTLSEFAPSSSFLLIYPKGVLGAWESNLGFSFCPDIDLHLPHRNLTLSQISASLLHLVNIQKLLGDGRGVANCWKQGQREKQLPFYFTKNLPGFVNHPSYLLRLWFGNLFSFNKHVSICLPLSTSLHPIWLSSTARICAFLRATYASAKVLCQIAVSISCLDIQTDFCDLDPHLARLSPGLKPLGHIAYNTHPHPSTF